MPTVALLQLFDRDGKPQLTGDSNLKDHIYWVQLTSFSFGVPDRNRNPKPPIGITLPATGAAAAELWRACTSGIVYERGTIDIFKTSGAESTWMLRVDLKLVAFDSVNMPGGSQGNGRTAPLANASVSYQELTTTYRNAEQQGGGLSGLPTDLGTLGPP